MKINCYYFSSQITSDVCLGSLILSFTCNFFAYFKFHCDWGRVIGKIKQNELDWRDTVPLKDSALTAVKGMQNSNKGMWKVYHFSVERIPKGNLFREKWYVKGWRVGPRAEPPGINICWVPLPPPGGELKQHRWRRLRKRHLKSEVALLQTLDRLFHLVQFVKCWQFLLKLNSNRIQRKKKQLVALCSRPPQNEIWGIFKL